MLKYLTHAAAISLGVFTVTGTATTPASAGEESPSAQQAPADEPGQCLDAVIIRSGPHVGDTAYGQCNPGNATTAHCWVEGDPVTEGDITYYTWSYITDNSTGISGYVSNAYYTVGNDQLGQC